MILFFGTRPGKSTLKDLPHTSCPFCRQIGTLTVSQTSNYAHLFWIKLFKITSHVVAECEHCKRVYYKEEFTQEMLKAIDE
ncbi:zinc-ribbon domain-containing protein [Maribacter chungangensis]|uniref:Zinc-ribbon domain-containing protein n=1 Tax=Maribacter chungangensis TaxID=1069117 RepID=A0ABW3B848_9FLAO